MYKLFIVCLVICLGRVVVFAEASFIQKLEQSGVELEVYPALIAFRYKNPQNPLWSKINYLNGTINRLGGWHKTEEIFSFLKKFWQVEEKKYDLSDYNQKLFSVYTYEIVDKNTPQKLYCGQSQKNASGGYTLLFEFCFVPQQKVDEKSILESFFQDFALNETWPKKFSEDILVFHGKNSFYMPPLWLLRYQEEERAYFTDVAGFAELEIYREKLKPREIEKFSINLWEKAILEKIGQGTTPQKLSRQKAHCFLLKKQESHLNFCYVLHNQERIVMVAAFPEKLYKAEVLANFQLDVLEKWTID